jgi:DNA polymerase elongation subunit (family B)
MSVCGDEESLANFTMCPSAEDHFNSSSVPLRKPSDSRVEKEKVEVNTAPLIYHLDVAAMYPNIILTNILQPTAIVTKFVFV